MEIIMEQSKKSTSLYSQHNGADKEYHAYVREKEGAWTVDFAHGARGGALKTGTKTDTPVDYAMAIKIFDRLVNKKKNGESHYTEGAAGTAYDSIPDAKALFGMFPQQPTAINQKDLQSLIPDDGWGFQIKANGENRLFRMDENGCGHGGNKKGQLVSIPSHWVEEFRAFGPFVANGEHVGDRFLAFDLLEHRGEDLRGLPQRRRYAMLCRMYEGMSNVAPSFGVIECHYSQASKQALLQHVKETQLEGIVAKNAGVAYRQGRGTDTLKFVLREICTCIVIARNAQRSVQIGLLNGDGVVVSCGNVTIPINKPVPEKDDLVDVQYMYFNGVAFEIPVYDPDNKSPRKDVDRDECSFQQISRHKPQDQDHHLGTFL